jgi:preprotein translocase subunit SecD
MSVFAACGGGSAARPSTSLSRNGVLVTLRFATRGPKDVEVARSILLHRFAGLGVRGATIDVDLGRQLMFVRLPAASLRSVSLMKFMFSTAELRFRRVLGYLPYATPQSTTAQTASSTCENGKLVTQRDKDTAANPQVVLPDKADEHGRHQLCYVLGPTLLTGRNIGKAAKTLNQQNGWEVDVTFANDDFVKKVAEPYVNENIAIVLDGTVQSAPTINPGITGRNVTISGTFTEAEANALALALKYGSLPLDFEVTSIKPGA